MHLLHSAPTQCPPDRLPPQRHQRLQLRALLWLWMRVVGGLPPAVWSNPDSLVATTRLQQAVPRQHIHPCLPPSP